MRFESDENIRGGRVKHQVGWRVERGGGPSVHEASRRPASIACPRGGRHHAWSRRGGKREKGMDSISHVTDHS